MSEFSLDHRLQSDCLHIGDLELCRLLLMNDQRWPWLILVPRVVDGIEIHDLPSDLQVILAQETSRCAQALTQIYPGSKINTGALGNVVRQLHVHVIARNNGDDNWPLPVWGFGKKRAYSATDSSGLIKTISNKLMNKHSS